MHEALTHSRGCEQARERREVQQKEWRARWPDHCRRCEGHTGCDNPCPGTQGRLCLLDLTCPRCGTYRALHPEDAAIPCRVCGWEDGAEKRGHGCPPKHECTCRVAKERKRQEVLSIRQREIERHEAELRRLRALQCTKS